jgi:hypothetical protein
MMRASVSPVTFAGTGGVSRCFRCKNNVTFFLAKKSLFALFTVLRLTPSRFAKTSCLSAVLPPDVSSARIILARVTSLTLCAPVLLYRSRSARSFAVSFIVSFLM